MTDQVREPQFAPMSLAGRGHGWYRGDCHVHSERSHGGELTAEQLAAPPPARASRLTRTHPTLAAFSCTRSMVRRDRDMERAMELGPALERGQQRGGSRMGAGPRRRHPRRALAARDG